MSTTFLTLVNTVLNSFGQVNLTVDEFNTARGFHAQVKNAVNLAIQELNQQQFEWPFNHQTASVTLTPGTSVYSFPDTLKIADMTTFRIAKDDSLNVNASLLTEIDYNTYLSQFFVDESNSGEAGRDTPTKVYRTKTTSFGVYPSPDKAYVMSYDYFQYPVDLVNHGDLLSIPDAYVNVIITGASKYCHEFRDNDQMVAYNDQKFKTGIEKMRTLLINRHTRVRDTRVSRVVRSVPGDL